MVREPGLLALALGGLATLAAAMGIGRFVYTPILPPMMEALGLTETQAGLIASANFGGYLVGALLAATPLLTGSRRNWLLGALGASALTTGAMALFSSMTAFVLLRFAGGVASALALVFSSALVLDRLALAGRANLSAVHFAGVGIGIALSALLVSALLAYGYDWRSLWLVSALVALIALVAVVRLVPDRSEVAARTGSGTGPMSRGLKTLAFAYGLFGFGYVITATFLVAIVRSSAQASAVEPVVWLVVGLAAVPSVVLWMRVGARIGIERAFAAACAIEAVGVAASVLWLDVAGVLLAAVLLGGTVMGITALGLIGARKLARGDPRHTMAMITAAFGVGQIVGPTFAGLMYDFTGSFLLPSLLAVGALLLAALLVNAQSGTAKS
jgi:predicted MFS family arabinose efflux permease